MIIRDLLPKRPKLKILLMSATLNASSFASYFGQKVPMLDIPGRTFPVKQIFLEEILDRIQFTIGKKNQSNIYDRVQNRKNYFEIPAFCHLNEESQERENSNYCDTNINIIF